MRDPVHPGALAQGPASADLAATWGLPVSDNDRQLVQFVIAVLGPLAGFALGVWMARRG